MSTNHTQVKLGAVFHRTEVLKFTGSSRGKVEREREVGGGRRGSVYVQYGTLPSYTNFFCLPDIGMGSVMTSTKWCP